MRHTQLGSVELGVGAGDGASLREARDGEAGGDSLKGSLLSAAPPKEVLVTNVSVRLVTKERK